MYMRKQTMKLSRQLKIELCSAVVAVFAAAAALTTATYAWYVANNQVTATSSTISAKTNGFVLQIADAKDGTVHGTGGTLTHTVTPGGILSPASSDDMKDWFVMGGLNEQGKITDYNTPPFVDQVNKPGEYEVMGKTYYAYIRSDYVVYTVSETGFANVYLEVGENNEPPVVITPNGADKVLDTFKDSLRVAITTQDYDPVNRTGTGAETLKVVYAMADETGIGNDADGKTGWTSIRRDGETSIKLDTVTYPYVYKDWYTDQNGNNWAATKQGDDYTVPAGSLPIAERVDYDGTLIHIYIWLEGTDADCVNGKSIEDDPATYDVTVKLAGVAVGNT